MKQTSNLINLIDFTDDDHPFGNIQGKKTFQKLSSYIDKHPTVRVFDISLKDIVATDASFPRESVISIAKLYREEKGFYLSDLNDRDLIDNWDYAAKIKKQPLVIWNKNEFEFIGPALTSANVELVNYIHSKKEVTTSQAAHDLDISVQNASAKLKKLATQGFVMRSETSSESGGIEFIYHIIKKSD